MSIVRLDAISQIMRQNNDSMLSQKFNIRDIPVADEQDQHSAHTPYMDGNTQTYSLWLPRSVETRAKDLQRAKGTRAGKPSLRMQPKK